MLRNLQIAPGLVLVSAFVLLAGSGACSGNDDASGGSGGATTAGSGGSQVGGATNGGSSPGGAANGGSTNSMGGETSLSGGSNGGSLASGGTPANGGANSGGANTGGSSKGGANGAGGASAGAGGKGGANTGGANTGGSKGGGGNNGGSAGKASSGGASSGGASTGGSGGASASCPGADAAELTLIKGWLNNTSAVGAMPKYAYDNIAKNFPAGAAFEKLACSIVTSCMQFAPSETNWLRKCEAVITSAIVAESSYNPASVVTDAYATRSVGGVTANDPTVGLLQIRFSSTVNNYNFYGPMAKMAAIGCTWPSALTSQPNTESWWATNGGTTYLPFMQDVACNVGLATWYYFYNATGNGGASAVWISDYCAGRGVAGNMVVGLLSHLMGGSYPRPADVNNAYPWGVECCSGGNPAVTTCTGCTGRFAAFMGIGTSASRPSPDPFVEVLAPQPAKYCR